MNDLENKFCDLKNAPPSDKEAKRDALIMALMLPLSSMCSLTAFRVDIFLLLTQFVICCETRAIKREHNRRYAINRFALFTIMELAQFVIIIAYAVQVVLHG